MSVSLTNEEQYQISIALSYINSKCQGRLRNVTINGSIGVLVYGRKHTDRVMVNLVSEESAKNWINEKYTLEVRYYKQFLSYYMQYNLIINICQKYIYILGKTCKCYRKLKAP
jgi:hypothetical protein